MSRSDCLPEYDAVVLAGGAARRMGGQHKPSLYVGSSTLLARAVSAVVGARRVVVVGPVVPLDRHVVWTREEPARAGPVAALRAGLARVDADRVVLLAADLPFVTTEAVDSLLAAIVYDGALLVDESGRDQFLCSAWRTASLVEADLTTDRLSVVVGSLRATRLALPGAPWTDCDTPEDLQRAREAVIA